MITLSYLANCFLILIKILTEIVLELVSDVEKSRIVTSLIIYYFELINYENKAYNWYLIITYWKFDSNIRLHTLIWYFFI